MLLCQGDSGGPLTQDGILVGVVSSGDVTGFQCDTSVSIQDCYRDCLEDRPKYSKRYLVSCSGAKQLWR